MRSADGPRVAEGVHENAPFRWEVPARWNGGLVMFAHGYQGEGPGVGAVRSEPLDALLSERGYAWAATGENGVKPAGDGGLATPVAQLGRRWTPRPHPADTAR